MWWQSRTSSSLLVCAPWSALCSCLIADTLQQWFDRVFGALLARKQCRSRGSRTVRQAIQSELTQYRQLKREHGAVRVFCTCGGMKNSTSRSCAADFRWQTEAASRLDGCVYPSLTCFQLRSYFARNCSHEPYRSLPKGHAWDLR